MAGCSSQLAGSRQEPQWGLCARASTGCCECDDICVLGHGPYAGARTGDPLRSLSCRGVHEPLPRRGARGRRALRRRSRGVAVPARPQHSRRTQRERAGRPDGDRTRTFGTVLILRQRVPERGPSAK
jgi:hypothetical protein